MNDLDIPNLPFKKPDKIEKLEKLTFEQREAMDNEEVKERISQVAYSLAKASMDHNGKDFEACVDMVSQALTELGGSLGGHFGASMVARSENAALIACNDLFSKD